MDDPNFGSPEFDLMLDGPAFVSASPVPEGTYYWRVAVMRDGEASGWSTPVQVKSIVVPRADRYETASPRSAAALATRRQSNWVSPGSCNAKTPGWCATLETTRLADVEGR